MIHERTEIAMRRKIIGKRLLCVWLLGALVARPDVLGGDPDTVLVAKGFNVITVRVSTMHDISHFDLDVSFDGQTFRNCGVGLPRPERLFYTISRTGPNVTISVPVVGVLSGGVERFLFREPGQNWFRWKIEYQDGSNPSTIEQAVIVHDSRGADQAFVQRLADVPLCKLMFGDNWFDQFTETEANHYADPEVRAVKVIGNLLEATRDRTPGYAQGVVASKGDLKKAADVLWQLARDIPDSSYAPYAAYYAACCYAMLAGGRMDEAMRANLKVGESYTAAAARLGPGILVADPDAARAKEALTFAVERADIYLKPRALHHLAGYHSGIGDLKRSEVLLDSAEAAAPGDGEIKAWCDKSREQIARARAAVEQSETGNSARRPDAPKP